ncbi:zeta toxin family protein [Microbacterium aurum]
MNAPAAESDLFEAVVVPVVFRSIEPAEEPALTLALSGSVSGRTRVTGRAVDGGAVVNARDLEILAHRLAPNESAGSVAAEWLQRALGEARRRRISMTVEGAFRSPGLVSGIAQLFAGEGYATRIAVVAERVVEVQMSDASRRFDVRLRRRADGVGFPDAATRELAPLVDAVISTGATDLVVVVDRDGNAVVDAGRGTPAYESAGAAFAEAAARPLGTLRSTLWLSELRHMTRLLTEQRTAPRWAVDDLVALHELALSDIIPELPIPADAEARAIEMERLSGTLSALRKSVTSEPTDKTGPVVVPHLDGVGLSR